MARRKKDDWDERLSEASKIDITPEKNGRRKEIAGWIRTIIVVVAVVFVLTRVVFINARVPTGSMENTIMPKDRLVGFRFSYWFADPERGDIVLFSYPVDESQTYIKRVIGLPGETVEIRDGKIYIDGSDEPLDEDYLKDEWTVANDGYFFEVPDDSYLMMGDNRNSSSDCRYWAENAVNELHITEEAAESYSYVSQKKIKGKAVFTYYPSFKLLTGD